MFGGLPGFGDTQQRCAEFASPYFQTIGSFADVVRDVIRDAEESAARAEAEWAALPPCWARGSNATLPGPIIKQILSQLPSNDIAVSVRLVNQELRQDFSAPHHRRVRTSQPVPHTALVWACRHRPLWGSLAPLEQLRLVALAVAGTTSEHELFPLWPCLWQMLHVPLSPEHAARRDPGVLSAAAGNREALVWLRSRSWPLRGTQLMEAAARSADAPFLRWLHTSLLRGQEGLSPLVLTAAVRSGTPDAGEKVEWLLASGCSFDSHTAAAAARHGHGELLRRLHGAGCLVDSKALRGALAAGDTALADWIIAAVGCPLTRGVGFEAATCGACECRTDAALHWLLERLCPDYGVDLSSQVLARCLAARDGGVAALDGRLRELGLAPGCTTARQRAASEALRAALEAAEAEALRQRQLRREQREQRQGQGQGQRSGGRGPQLVQAWRAWLPPFLVRRSAAQQAVLQG